MVKMWKTVNLACKEAASLRLSRIVKVPIFRRVIWIGGGHVLPISRGRMMLKVALRSSELPGH